MPERRGSDQPEIVEIACDESGFTGGNLTFAHTVFAHASVRISPEVAAEEMARLRQRVAARGELKASWLLRWCDRDDLSRLLGDRGVIETGFVHLSDIRLFLLLRLSDALLGSAPVNGLELPGRDDVARAVALTLRQSGEGVYGEDAWSAFLTAAGHALRATSRWVPRTAADDLAAALADLSRRPAPGSVRSAMRRLSASAQRARPLRLVLDADPRRPPLVEPLIPALMRALQWWSSDQPSLRILHDEQSALTRGRLAAMSRRLTAQRPGTAVEVIRLDSRDDPRVQVADLVAGISRRAATGLLTGRSDPALMELVRPLVDPESIWADDVWCVAAPEPTSPQAGGSSGVAS